MLVAIWDEPPLWRPAPLALSTVVAERVTIHEFLSRLQRVKKQKDGWVASCPSHEDKTPSLSVKEGTDGIVLKCHAGCSVESIVAALHVELADLFPTDTKSPPKTIQDTYDYRDEDRAILFQSVRFVPKDFKQRRQNGTGGWIWNLNGVRLVVYRLPELKDQPAILWCEGEKDVKAAVALGIPATCNPMGAGKWRAEYAQQLVQQGVQRVAVIPDNDTSGIDHAGLVAGGLHAAGLAVRLLQPLPGSPPKGDLSDYLASGHDKAALLGLIKATPVWTGEPVASVVAGPDKEFKALGPQHYGFEIHSAGIVFDLDRIHRKSHELWGELLVRVNGAFPEAKTFQHGTLQVGDLNLSSVQARQSRAKLLAERSGNRDVDWFGFIEEFTVRTLAADREGEPSVGLSDITSEAGSGETWTVGGFPLLADLPLVLFGDASATKSYMALWLAGALALRDIPVLYVDWEFSGFEHRKRLERLFQPPPSAEVLRYRRADRPLIRVIDGVLADMQRWKIQYVVCDSIGFALEGSPMDPEAATRYFAAVRRFNCGSLHLAHIAKHQDEGKDPSIFGSTFFKAGAKSTWYIERTTDNPDNEVRVGLYQRKFNGGPQRQAPLGYRFVFESARTLVEPINVETEDELSVHLPLVQRLRAALQDGPRSVKALSEELSSTPNIVRAIVSKHKSSFVRTGDKIGILAAAAADEGLMF